MESSDWDAWRVPGSLSYPPHPSPVPIPSPLEGSEQSGKGHAWQRHSPPTLGAHPALVTGQGRRCCPAHQDLSQFFFLAFPWLLPIHFSGFLPGPEITEKRISLLHLRSKCISTFPFPFFFFHQSSCNRATNSERLSFNIYWQVNSRSCALEPWSHSCIFELCQLLAWISHFLICKTGIIITFII